MNSAKRQRLKANLAARDGRWCFYCGTGFADLVDATIDHLIPKSVMPGWKQFNLVLACRPCNEAKADQLPQVFLRQVAATTARREASRRRRVSCPAPVRTRARVALAA